MAETTELKIPTDEEIESLRKRLAAKQDEREGLRKECQQLTRQLDEAVTLKNAHAKVEGMSDAEASAVVKVATLSGKATPRQPKK